MFDLIRLQVKKWESAGFQWYLLGDGCCVCVSRELGVQWLFKTRKCYLEVELSTHILLITDLRLREFVWICQRSAVSMEQSVSSAARVLIIHHEVTL